MIGELSGDLATRGSIFDSALRMVPVAAPRVSPLLGLVLENPAKACWCKPAVISDPCTCALIA